MLHHIQQIFHSIIKSLEVLYVIEGTKPCARILVFEDDLEKIIDFLRENQLFFALSDFKVIKENKQSEFYSDKSLKIQKNALEKGHFFVYLSKDKKIAQEAKIAEADSNHTRLGLLLGYPECCCNFFASNFNDESSDLTLKILQNSYGFEFQFYNNVAARHFDIALLNHFPHSFDCKPSIEIAKNNLETIKKSLPQLADLFAKTLQSTVIYTFEEGIFLLRKYEKINDEIIYNDILTTIKSKLFYLISSNKKLKIIDRNNFFVNKINIKGSDYGIMIFS